MSRPRKENQSQPVQTPTERVMRALARLYAESTAGSSAHAARDFLVDLKTLLKAAKCDDGDERAEALNQLRALEGKVVRLERPRRDPEIIHQVRVPLANEAALFAWLKEPSPTELRQALALQFADPRPSQCL